MKTTNDIVKVLSNNAVFQLSLSSKELFHSNFLYWIATSIPELFNQLLEQLGIDFKYNPDKHVVCREYNHFDFCICEKKSAADRYNASAEDNIISEFDNSSAESVDGEKGRVLLILENKFKSIPYIKQLDTYRSKVKKLNNEAIWVYRPKDGPKRGKEKYINEHSGELEPYYVLLTLDNEIKTDSSWKKVTYLEYANGLKNSIAGIRSDKFTEQLLKKYIEFIEAISNYVKNNLVFEGLTWGDMQKPELIKLRINDVWQKLVVSKCLAQLPPDWENSQDFDESDFFNGSRFGNVYKQLYYGKSGAAINVYIPLLTGDVYHVQVQGDLYKRGLFCKDKDPKNIKERLNVAPYLFEEDYWTGIITGKKEKAGQYSGIHPYHYKSVILNKSCSLKCICDTIKKDIENHPGLTKNKDCAVSFSSQLLRCNGIRPNTSD